MNEWKVDAYSPLEYRAQLEAKELYADLARELYESLKAKSDKRIAQALARYEREVGE